MDVRTWWHNVRRFLAWLSAGEALPRTGRRSTTPPRRSLADVAGWLLSPEQLPLDEPLPTGSAVTTGSPARWLLSPESLPEAPREDSTGRGSIASLVGWLLTPERLPITESDSVRSRPSVVKWLFASEPLPPPTDGTTAPKSQEA